MYLFINLFSRVEHGVLRMWVRDGTALRQFFPFFLFHWAHTKKIFQGYLWPLLYDSPWHGKMNSFILLFHALNKWRVISWTIISRPHPMESSLFLYELNKKKIRISDMRCTEKKTRHEKATIYHLSAIMKSKKHQIGDGTVELWGVKCAKIPNVVDILCT